MLDTDVRTGRDSSSLRTEKCDARNEECEEIPLSTPQCGGGLRILRVVVAGLGRRGNADGI